MGRRPVFRCLFSKWLRSSSVSAGDQNEPQQALHRPSRLGQGGFGELSWRLPWDTTPKTVPYMMEHLGLQGRKSRSLGGNCALVIQDLEGDNEKPLVQSGWSPGEVDGDGHLCVTDSMKTPAPALWWEVAFSLPD